MVNGDRCPSKRWPLTPFNELQNDSDPKAFCLRVADGFLLGQSSEETQCRDYFTLRSSTSERTAESIKVVPGSGTGALAGLEGDFALTIVAGVHHYDLGYTLPAG